MTRGCESYPSTMPLRSLTRQQVLEEISGLSEKTRALPPEEAALHLSFLEFARSAFQENAVGIRLRKFQPDGTVGIVAIFQDGGAHYSGGAFRAQPDQARWLIRRVAMTHQIFLAVTTERRKAQDVVDGAGVAQRVRPLEAREMERMLSRAGGS